MSRPSTDAALSTGSAPIVPLTDSATASSASTTVRPSTDAPLEGKDATTAPADAAARSSNVGSAPGAAGQAGEEVPPPPVTFFSTIAKSFGDVTVTDEGINTDEFLEASEGVVSLLNLLGSTAFGVVISDINGNIAKIRARRIASDSAESVKVKGQRSDTLQKLVKNEVADDKKRTATQGLLWLLRGLDFILKAMQKSVATPTEELSVSFTAAYKETLQKYHSIIVKPLFAIAMKACPYRKDFYKKLADEASQEQVAIELKAWLDGLDSIVTTMQKFYTAGKHDKGL